MLKPHLLLAVITAFSLNSLALYIVVNIIKRYSSIKNDQTVDRSIRKAYVSRKKREIMMTQVKRIRGKIFKLSFYQFFIPMATFIASIIIYIPLSLVTFPNEDPLIIHLDRYCIAPIPMQIPSEQGKCVMQISWIFFLVFLLYLPLYTYYTKKYLET